MIYLFSITLCPAVKVITHLANYLLIKKCNGENLRDKNIVVIFRCTQESWFNPFRTLKLHWQNHTHIIYKSVSSVEEMTAFLEKMKHQNNRIQGLWLRAHGSPHSMTIGNEDIRNNAERIEENNRVYLLEKNSDKLKAALKHLEKNTTIILESCSTGKLKTPSCIAQTIATLAPGTTVIAPNRNVTSTEMNFFWNDKQLDCKILRKKISKLEGFTGKLLNFYYDMVRDFTFAHYGWEDQHNTVRFKHFTNFLP